MDNPAYDWRISLRKAATHAAYAAGAVLALWLVDAVGHFQYFMQPPGVFLVVPVQMALKGLGNWMANH